ncbi:kinase-like protein [Athelia psychrophila]|uniref:Kinase-like protein n=1 Tax=Athelia psychrophila TaxID=1759441 RepID=A0A166SUB3_9AGAM|nr:kinase-like protein [Fibularhizoctonia sp. CBS 109695]
MDVIGLSAHLAVAITDDDLYKEFYARRYVSAQLLLDLLQAVYLYIDPAFKQRHVKALVKLSESSGLFPTCLVLSDVTLEPDPVASGGFGEVYKGALRGHLIAVKMLKVYKSSVVARILKEFAREAVTWRQLSHPNVLPFYGVYHLNKASPRVCLVCPWMEQGNAVEYLARADENGQNVDCVTLALDVAKGLEHLHSVNIIHADLKGLNILITPSLRACLADFGLAATRDSSKPYTQSAISSTGHATGTLRWQAPELFPSFESTGSTDSDSKLHNTKATDIYAYAMTVYELFSGIYPFTDRSVGDYQVIRAVSQGIRPSRPADSRAIARGLDDAVWTIVNECWAQDPQSRPTSETVVSRLEGLHGLAEDTRVKDEFDLGLMTKVLQTKAEHPFATLVVDGPETVNN